jgi:hypothetical protein
LNTGGWAQIALTQAKKPTASNDDGLAQKLSRGDWIRTSDLLNPIQEVRRVNIAENTSLSWLTAFYLFDVLKEFGHFSSFSLPNSALGQTA